MKSSKEGLRPNRSEKRNKRKKIVEERLKRELIQNKRRRSVLREKNKKPFWSNRIRSVVRWRLTI